MAGSAACSVSSKSRQQPPPARLASYMARSARASRVGRSRYGSHSAIPTLMLNVTGFPSLPTTRAGGLDFGLVVSHQLAAAQRLREFGPQARGQVFGFDCHPRPFSSVTTGLLVLHTVTTSHMVS